MSVRLDPTNPQRGAFSRAAGARRFCFNAAAAAIGENHAEWSAQQAGGVPAGDRVRPLSAQDLERRWRFFPSSKTCAACGTVKPKLGLGERTYHCDTCGHITDRDVNAAATLAAWGEHTLGRCPCVTQARDPNPSGRSGTLFHACGGWVSADPAPAGCGAVQ